VCTGTTVPGTVPGPGASTCIYLVVNISVYLYVGPLRGLNKSNKDFVAMRRPRVTILPIFILYYCTRFTLNLYLTMAESLPLGVACPNLDSFPCNAGALEAISLPLAAAGAGLCMSLFLTKKVGHRFLLCVCVCVCVFV
jgi:hypothetical protein